MKTITVEVSDDIAKKFSGKAIVKYEEILDYEDNLKYSFSGEEHVTLNELSDFLWKCISSKKEMIC